MKLSELNGICDGVSWDTADSVYDAIVHLELDRTPLEPDSKWVDRFTQAAYDKINVEKIFDGAYANAICHYHSLFEDNIELWRTWTKDHWSENYHNLFEDDIDTYIYELIESLNGWFAGLCSEEDFKELYNIIIKCK